jgi:cation/acetate symporter
VSNGLDAVSLGIALMLGLLGLPHILMRFYTVPDAKAARTSVLYATGFIGYFYIIIPIVGFGAAALVGRDLITKIDKGGNMAAPILAEQLGGTPFLGFIAAVAFATILAVVAGLTLAGASALSHDIYVHVVRKGHASEVEQVRVARRATVAFGAAAVLLGIVFKDQNVAFMVGLAFAVASSANFPALLLSVVWKNISTKGATYSIYTGGFLALALIIMSPTVWVDIFHKTEVTTVNKVATDAKKAIDADLAAKLTPALSPAEADKFKADATAAKAAADAKAKADMPKPIIKYKNPGIFSMGAAFLVAIIFSLIFPEGGNVDKRFEDEKIRTYLGIGAE